ncbi:MAG: hypothetical protein LBF22_13780 [Deltaproteobacteria bacterium]|jgi:hypothetical protein|nr:hypothetical protein [Deltaproteobacteria bacterium]
METQTENVKNKIKVDDWIAGYKEGFKIGFFVVKQTTCEANFEKCRIKGRKEKRKEICIELALAFIDDGWTDLPKLRKLCKITKNELEAALEARKI